MPALPSIESLIIVAAVAIIAITFHEAAHGFVAYRLGDPTAYQQGRVSFNPLRHIDPLGTVVLPLLIFLYTSNYYEPGWFLGWAKPVPITPERLRAPRRDMILVAAAGPATNLALAVISALLLALYGATSDKSDFIGQLLSSSIYFNVLVVVFNLIPLLPFDGGRIAVGLLPASIAFPLARLEPIAMWIVFGLLLIVPPVTFQLGHQIDLFTALIQPVVNAISDSITSVFGVGDAT